MRKNETISRRGAMKTGAVALASSMLVKKETYADAIQPKEPDETKIVAVMGDYWHPAAAQERHVRQILGDIPKSRIYFVQASRYLTADLLLDADLFISARYGGRDDPGWVTNPVVEDRPQGDEIWTNEHIEAIIDTVSNKGMGWIAAHCTQMNNNDRLTAFLGIDPILHQEIQPIVITDINQNHPITQGIDNFFINLDEQFDAHILQPTTTTQLFRTIAVHDKRNALGGWSLERGKGRIVGLLPGHYQWSYREPEYQKIFWRAAHWAMKRDIPAFQ